MVALLMAGLGEPRVTCLVGDGSRGWVFYRACGGRRHPMHMTVMQGFK